MKRLLMLLVIAGMLISAGCEEETDELAMQKHRISMMKEGGTLAEMEQRIAEEEIETLVEAPRELSEARKIQIQNRKANRKISNGMDEALRLYLEYKGKGTIEQQRQVDVTFQTYVDEIQELIDTQENSLFIISIQSKIDIMQLHLKY